MPQKKSQATDDRDPGQQLREESSQERREEEGGAPPDGARRARDGRGDGRPSRQRGGRDGGDGLQGRPPSPEPDVFMDVPKVQVEEVYLDVEGLDAHLSLRTKLGNLVQLVAGVHVHCGKVELDIKGVDAEAMLKTVDTAVDDIGQTAQTALGPRGAVSRTVDQVGQTAQQALGPGGAGSQALDRVGGAAQQAVGPAAWR